MLGAIGKSIECRNDQQTGFAEEVASLKQSLMSMQQMMMYQMMHQGLLPSVSNGALMPASAMIPASPIAYAMGQANTSVTPCTPLTTSSPFNLFASFPCNSATPSSNISTTTTVTQENNSTIPTSPSTNNTKIPTSPSKKYSIQPSTIETISTTTAPIQEKSKVDQIKNTNVTGTEIIQTPQPNNATNFSNFMNYYMTSTNQPGWINATISGTTQPSLSATTTNSVTTDDTPTKNKQDDFHQADHKA